MPSFVAIVPNQVRCDRGDGVVEVQMFARGTEIEAEHAPNKHWQAGTRADLKYSPLYDGLPPPTRDTHPGLIEPGRKPSYVAALEKIALASKGA